MDKKKLFDLIETNKYATENLIAFDNYRGEEFALAANRTLSSELENITKRIDEIDEPIKAEISSDIKKIKYALLQIINHSTDEDKTPLYVYNEYVYLKRQELKLKLKQIENS